MDNDELLVFRESLPKNVRLYESIPALDFHHETKIADDTAKIIGPFIDIDCSGVNKYRTPVYKVFNSLFELKKHASRDKLHDVSAGCVLNVDNPPEYNYYKVANGNTNFNYLKQEESEDTKRRINAGKNRNCGKKDNKKDQGEFSWINKGKKSGSMAYTEDPNQISFIGHRETSIKVNIYQNLIIYTYIGYCKKYEL
jgi:hypothetical protein